MAIASDDLRRSVLDGEHRALGARMTPFGGWEMPLRYEGVVQEHRWCRETGAVFDVSHLGSVRVRGEGAFEGLQALFTNDLSRIAPGRAQYTHLLDEADAHVVDDLIVWWVGPDDFLVIPNAANTAPTLEALRAAVPAGDVVDVTAERAFLAVQGPHARKILADVLPAAAEVRRFRVSEVEHDGERLLVGGTGYTGEDGVELFVPAPAAATLWRALLDAGPAPVGLGARDTLRLEMGLPLHGHELGAGITPLQAGLEWVVAWDKGEFRGREALARERERGVARRLRGLVSAGRRIPREGCPVLLGGDAVGEVTSGNFSPSLERGVALAFVPPDVAPPADAEVDVRGTRVPVEIVDPPFVSR